MKIFSLLAPAIVGQVTQEAPQPPVALPADRADESMAEAVQSALMAQASLLRAGFTEAQALAGAIDVLAHERPLIRGPVNGKARKMSQKRSRALRQIAAAIVIKEQSK